MLAVALKRPARAVCGSCGPAQISRGSRKLRTPLAEGIPPALCSFRLSSEPASKTRDHAGQQRHKYKQIRPKELAVLHRLNTLHAGAHQNLADAGGDYLHFADEETETQRHLSGLPVVLSLDQWQRRFCCMSPPWEQHLQLKN